MCVCVCVCVCACVRVCVCVCVCTQRLTDLPRGYYANALNTSNKQQLEPRTVAYFVWIIHLNC